MKPGHWGWLLLVVTQLACGAEILPAPEHVSPHAWAWIGPYGPPAKQNNGFRMNLGFVVGRDAVAVIDTGYTEEMAEEMVVAIKRVTPLPIRFAIATNSTPHRFMGNDVFRKHGARVIASVEAAERVEKEGGDYVRGVAASLEREPRVGVPKPPDQLIMSGTSARFNLGGGVAVEAIHVGRAHTSGSLIVRVTPDRVVYASDVLYAGRMAAVLPDSSVTGWIAAYERLRAIDALAFIPGHGPPGVLGKFDEPTFEYLKALKTHMDAAFKAGTDSSTAVRTFDASRWSKLANFNELSTRNAALAYLESERDGF